MGAALLVPTVAQAEPPLGSRLGNREKAPSNNRYDAQDSARTGHEFARCLYTRYRAAVGTYLSTTDSRLYERSSRNFYGSKDCAKITVLAASIGGISISIPNDLMRGMLAEASLRDTREADSLVALPSPVPGTANYVRDWFAFTGRDPSVNEMAVCVADQNPEGIRALIVTKAESLEEKTAIQSIASWLGPCLPAGATLKANRPSLRAALTEALYHRANAPAFTASN